jgi:CRP-like cAMP-binding protein
MEVLPPAVKTPQKFSSAYFLETAAKGRVLSTQPPGELLFTQGDEADCVFYIRRGKVKVTVLSMQGKEAIIAVLNADEFVGEGCLIGQPLRLSTAVAMTECVTMRLERTEMLRVLHDEPSFADMFVAHILTRSARVEEDLIDQLFNSTEKRLARVLLLLANFGKEGRPEPIINGVNQAMLADMVGTTRPHVNRFMTKFRDLGFVSYNGRLEVHPSLLSVVLNDRPSATKSSSAKPIRRGAQSARGKAF